MSLLEPIWVSEESRDTVGFVKIYASGTTEFSDSSQSEWFQYGTYQFKFEILNVVNA